MKRRSNVPALSLVTHENDGRPEVGVTNLYGTVRVQDFWSDSEATVEECDEYIHRLEEASHRITQGILRRRVEKKDA
jgi:hypothetical protein